MRSSLAFSSLLLLLVIAGGCATQTAPAPALRPVAAQGALNADGTVAWYRATDIGLEGQGWSTLNAPYDRLPPEAEGQVTEHVWGLSHHSAGLCAHFVTDSPKILARWSLTSDRLGMPHMPATGVSGVDLYVKDQGRWGWIGMGRPEKAKDNEAVLAADIPAGPHEYLLYLPLYNGTEKLEIGLAPGATIQRAAFPGKPVLVWGTSIVQGGCASRPGMAYPAILGRRLNCSTINLGFSGNGRMDPPLAALVAKLDMAAFVIDCAPNMDPALITERTEPLVRGLRAAHADTPIVLVENVPYQKGWFLAEARESYEKKNKALRESFERLQAVGVRHLYYVPCTDLFGPDNDATVDGTHATDLGFYRMADAIEPFLRRALSQP